MSSCSAHGALTTRDRKSVVESISDHCEYGDDQRMTRRGPPNVFCHTEVPARSQDDGTAFDLQHLLLCMLLLQSNALALRAQR